MNVWRLISIEPMTWQDKAEATRELENGDKERKKGGDTGTAIT